MFLVTAGIFSGMVRQSRDRGWKSIHWVFPFYSGSYPDLELIPTRFAYSFLFLPLFAAGLWFEAKHFLTITYTTITQNPDRAKRLLPGSSLLGSWH